MGHDFFSNAMFGAAFALGWKAMQFVANFVLAALHHADPDED